MLLNCPYNTLFYCKTTDDSSQGNDSPSLLQYYSSSRNASKRSVPYVISVMIPPPSHSIFTVMPQNWTPAFLPDFALQYACCFYCKTDRAYFSTCMAVSYISYNMQLLLPGTFCYAFMNAIISYFIISNCCSFSAYMPQVCHHLTKSSKSPASIAKNNKQWVGDLLVSGGVQAPPDKLRSSYLV